MGVHPVHAALTTEYVQKLISIKARQLVRKPGFSRSDQPDAEQELVAHILRAAHLFDPGRGSVRTFIARVVDSAVAMILRDRRRLKRAAGFRVLSLADPAFSGTDHESTLAETIEEADLRRRCGGGVCRRDDEDRVQAIDLARILAGLPPHLQEMAGWLKEESEAAVARDLGISRRQVRKAVAQIREAFEAAGLAEIQRPGGQIPDRRHK
jgi:RNA polymerase sigma factor (sigma-70 family)